MDIQLEIRIVYEGNQVARAGLILPLRIQKKQYVLLLQDWEWLQAAPPQMEWAEIMMTCNDNPVGGFPVQFQQIHPERGEALAVLHAPDLLHRESISQQNDLWLLARGYRQPWYEMPLRQRSACLLSLIHVTGICHRFTAAAYEVDCGRVRDFYDFLYEFGIQIMGEHHYPGANLDAFHDVLSSSVWTQPVKPRLLLRGFSRRWKRRKREFSGAYDKRNTLEILGAFFDVVPEG